MREESRYVIIGSCPLVLIIMGEELQDEIRKILRIDMATDRKSVV